MTEHRSAVDRLRKAGQTHTPFGIFISSIDPASTEIAGLSGYDFIMIDGEHGALDRQEVLNHVRAAEAVGIVPLVRGLYKTPIFIQSMLDLGVAGVVLPKLETAEEAHVAVAATRYAPEGTRGMCPACHDGGYALQGFGERMKRRNREAMVIPIIETRKAVENIEEICAVDGMDLIHFGPGDLSADLGLDLATDIHLLQSAWIRVRDAAHAAGKYAFVPSGMNFDGGRRLYFPDGADPIARETNADRRGLPSDLSYITTYRSSGRCGTAAQHYTSGCKEHSNAVPAIWVAYGPIIVA